MTTSYYERNKEKIKASTKAWKEANPERKRELNREYKARNSDKVLAYAESRVELTKELNKARYIANKPEIQAQMKAYYEANASEILKKNSEYREVNRVAIRAQQREAKKRRMQQDPVFRLVELTRRRIAHALKGKATKSARTLELLGCTGAELRMHIEAQFTDGMSWEDRGAWHIDHIIPLSFFDLTDPEQQRKAFHYLNQQPLWSRDNRSKGSKVPLKALLMR